jgi:O-antigen/teichoic acid export membrane protein
MNHPDYFQTDHLKSGLRAKAVRGAGAVIFSQMFSVAGQLVGTMILARLLTPVDFGLLAMAMTFSLLFENLGFIGITEAIVQREDVDHGMITSLFWFNLLVSLSLTVVFMLLAPWIADFYGEPRVKGVAVGVALSIVACNLSTVHMGLLQRNMQFYETSLIAVASKWINMIVAILLAWYGWGYWSLVAGAVAMTSSTAAGAWLFCSWRPGPPSLHRGIGPLIRFALHTYGNYLLSYGSKNFGNLLIGWHFGSQSLGYFKKAYDLFSLPATFLTTNLASVALSSLSRIADEPEKYRRTYLESISTLAFIGMPLSAVLTVAGRDIILFVLGPQWTKAGDIFTYLGMGIGVMLIYATNGWLHLSLGRADRWLRWGVVEFVVTFLLIGIGMFFGPEGVALSWTLSFYILLAPGLRYAGSPVDLRFSGILPVIWKFFVCALLAGLSSWLLLYATEPVSFVFSGLPVLVRIVTSGILCCALYLLLVLVLHQGVEPISRFIRILKDMVPVSLKK